MVTQPIRRGSVDKSLGLRTHVDGLIANKPNLMRLLLSGRSGAKYLAMLPNVEAFGDWKVEHRYFASAELPSSSFEPWSVAALEIGRMLDQARLDGKT